MIRCGVDMPCEYKRHGNCENAQEVCPTDIVITLWESGKSVDYIENRVSYTKLEIYKILEYYHLF